MTMLYIWILFKVMAIHTYSHLGTKSNKNDSMVIVMGIYIIQVSEIYPVAQKCLPIDNSLF